MPTQPTPLNSKQPRGTSVQNGLGRQRQVMPAKGFNRVYKQTVSNDTSVEEKTRHLIKEVSSKEQHRIKLEYENHLQQTLLYTRQDSKPLKPVIQFEQKTNPIDAGNKLGLNMSGSVGIQVGEEFKILGMGIGAVVNAGSIEIVGSKLDAFGGSKTDIPGLSSTQIVFKQGLEGTLAIVSLEVNNEYTYDYTGKWYEHKQSSGTGLAFFKLTFEEIERYEYNEKNRKYLKVANRSNTLLTLAETKAVVALGGKIEVKAEATFNMGTRNWSKQRTHIAARDATIYVNPYRHYSLLSESPSVAFFKWVLSKH